MAHSRVGNPQEIFAYLVEVGYLDDKKDILELGERLMKYIKKWKQDQKDRYGYSKEKIEKRLLYFWEKFLRECQSGHNRIIWNEIMIREFASTFNFYNWQNSLTDVSEELNSTAGQRFIGQKYPEGAPISYREDFTRAHAFKAAPENGTIQSIYEASCYVKGMEWKIKGRKARYNPNEEAQLTEQEQWENIMGKHYLQTDSWIGLNKEVVADHFPAFWGMCDSVEIYIPKSTQNFIAGVKLEVEGQAITLFVSRLNGELVFKGSRFTGIKPVFEIYGQGDAYNYIKAMVHRMISILDRIGVIKTAEDIVEEELVEETQEAVQEVLAPEPQPKAKKARRQQLRNISIRQALKAFENLGIEIESGTKHTKLYYQKDGGRRMLPFLREHGKGRGASNNTARIITKAYKAMGFTREQFLLALEE